MYDMRGCPHKVMCEKQSSYPYKITTTKTNHKNFKFVNFRYNWVLTLNRNA